MYNQDYSKEALDKKDLLGIDLAAFSIEEEIAKHTNEDIPGWFLLLRLYVQPRKIGNIILPDIIQENDIYDSPVGLVVAKSPYAYMDSRYDQTGHWCQVGEWRIFERHRGYRIFENNIPYWYVPEDAIGKRVKDPSKIKRKLI